MAATAVPLAQFFNVALTDNSQSSAHSLFLKDSAANPNPVISSAQLQLATVGSLPFN